MISINNLSVNYTSIDNRTIKALENINLSIGESELVGVIGANGSGKSTLGKSIGGLLSPASGEIFIDGKSIEELRAEKSLYDSVGIVFQEPDNQLITNFVNNEIAFSLENRGESKAAMTTKVLEMLKVYGLEKLSSSSPSLLSGGQKQKLAIASILVSEPKFLVMDEPTSFLDPEARKTVFGLMKSELQRRKNDGFAIMFITQFAREAAACSRLIVLSEGKIVADDKPEIVFKKEYQLLKELGIEIPIEFKLNNKYPKYNIDSKIFNY